jgi:hypothetical protein
MFELRCELCDNEAVVLLIGGENVRGVALNKNPSSLQMRKVGTTERVKVWGLLPLLP